MIDPTIGNAMPFTPFGSMDPIECPPTIVSVTFMREMLRCKGWTPEQIETHIAELPRVRFDDDDQAHPPKETSPT